jgi:hypothetical protein
VRDRSRRDEVLIEVPLGRFSFTPATRLASIGMTSSVGLQQPDLELDLIEAPSTAS